MGQLWVWIWGFVISIAGPLISEIFKILGVGIAVYVGSDLLIDQLEAQVLSMLSESPAAVLQMLSIVGLDEAMSIILSGLAVEMSIKMASGKNKQLVLKA